MFVRMPIKCISFVFAALLLASPAARADWPHLNGMNLPVCTSTGIQNAAVVCGDGAGGAFTAWVDYRGGAVDIYAQHLLAGGIVDPAWPVNGRVVCNASGDQLSPRIVGDGAGGFIVAWQDSRGTDIEIYAVRMRLDGSVVSGWTANGTRVTTFTGDDDQLQAISDGAGGCYLGYVHHFSVTDWDPEIIRVLANGTTPVGWSPGTGNNVDGASTFQDAIQICLDGAGGVIVAYESNASGDYDIRAAHYDANGNTQWNTSVTASVSDQITPRITADGLGGAFVAWIDKFYEPNGDSYVIRLAPNGGSAPGWPAPVPLGSTLSSEAPFGIVADGNGGCFVGWTKAYFFTYFIYVTHIAASGAFAPGWTVPLSPNHVTLLTPNLISDGEGGVIVAFAYYSLGIASNAIAAQRFTGPGAIGPGWPGEDLDVCVAGGSKDAPAVVADGQGGFIAVWPDYRNGSPDIYAQRFERFGQLGNPEPHIAGVKDVPNDQGGKVRVSWSPSYFDAQPAPLVTSYRVWRQAPAFAAMAEIERGSAALETAVPTGEAGVAPPGAVPFAEGTRPVYRITRDAAQTYYWEQVASVSAATQSGYSVVTSTSGDSVASSNPYTAFMVDAMTYSGPYWSSAPDSGYSKDNLPPVAPAPFSATFTGPIGTFLDWGANSELDLAGYRLYKGAFPGFIPSVSNRIYQGAQPNYHDPGTHTALYKVCAYDIHGNEGLCAAVLATGATTDAGGAIPTVLAMSLASANPSNGDAVFTLALPRTARVSVAVFDAQGRRVATLLEELRPAGLHAIRWDGRDSGSSVVGSGLYFARAQVEGRTLLVRVSEMR